MASVWSAGVNSLPAWYLLRAGMSVLPDSIQMWLSVGRRAQLLWRGQWLKSCRTSEPRASDPDCRIATEVARKTLGKQMTFRSPRLSTKNSLRIKTCSVHKYFYSVVFLLFFCFVNFYVSRCQKDPDIRVSSCFLLFLSPNQWRRSVLDHSSAVRVAVAQQGRLEFALTLLCLDEDCRGDSSSASFCHSSR